MQLQPSLFSPRLEGCESVKLCQPAAYKLMSCSKSLPSHRTAEHRGQQVLLNEARPILYGHQGLLIIVMPHLPTRGVGHSRTLEELEEM